MKKREVVKLSMNVLNFKNKEDFKIREQIRPIILFL